MKYEMHGRRGRHDAGIWNGNPACLKTAPNDSANTCLQCEFLRSIVVIGTFNHLTEGLKNELQPVSEPVVC